MTNRDLVRRLFILLVLFVARPAQPQATSPQVIFGRLMEARMDSLALEPEVARRAPGVTGFALMQAAGDSAMYFVDDAGLSDLAALFAATAARATPQVCADFLTKGSEAFPEVFATALQSADSLLLDQWAGFMKLLVRAGITRPARGRMATADAVWEAVTRMINAQSPETRAHLQRGAAHTGSVDDECLFVRTLFKTFADESPSELGPVLRAMMAGVRPVPPGAR